MKHFDPRVRLPGFITSLFKDAIWRFDEPGQIVYLTFDDGPIPDVTPWILELLEKEDIKATFFCVGENVSNFPELYKQILDGGHSVGNHTYNHLQGLKNDNQNFIRNIEKAGLYIDSDLFRPPHGFMKSSQYKYLKEKFSIVMWDLVSCDYDSRLKPEKVLKNVKNFVRPGSILTFHDSKKAKKNLIKALPLSIKWMKEQGYSFETIPYKQRT
jgi:peptidoglycan/xylan/chitin deacetylase (PgdA/CDA1 family)